MHARQVILRPVVSEKSYALLAANKYTFRVHDRANKTQVRQAIEEIFGVRVRGRPHRLGQAQAEAPRRQQRHRRRWKKADRDPPRGGHDRAVRGPGDRSLMAIKKHKPTSPGRRFATWLQHEAVTKTEPEKSLTEGLKKSGGRNAHGRVTSRHRGGGAKRKYRKIDFKRRKDGVPAKVAAIEYDPNRSAHIALLHYLDGEKRYILAPARHLGGRHGVLGPDADIAPGNALPLSAIPTGTTVHNVELVPGRGGQLGRSAGTSIQVVAKEGTLRHPAAALERDAHGAGATAGPRSARSATPSTSWSSWARRAARATAASARRRAAWP